MEESEQHLYRHFDEWDNLLYVGVSLSTVQRLSQHKSQSHWFNKIQKITIQNFPSRREVLHAERIAIQKEEPLHNIALKKTCDPVPRVGVDKIRGSLDNLVSTIVQYKPIYTIEQTAHLFEVSTSKIKEWCEKSELGYVEIGRVWDARWNKWRIKKRITGWQILDFIENLENDKRNIKDVSLYTN